MKPIVVAITGEAHSGKDTSADYVVSYLKSLGANAIKIGLADRLKFICQRLVKLFYNIDIPIEDFFDMDKKEEIRYDYPQFAGQPFKLRTILQLVGSEVFREQLWSSIWCDYVYRTFLAEENYHVIVISDCRFPDELEYFMNLHRTQKLSDIISCRLVRPTKQAISAQNQLHQSEQHISKLPVQFEIINDQTLIDLQSKLKEIIIDKIIHSEVGEIVNDICNQII